MRRSLKLRCILLFLRHIECVGWLTPQCLMVSRRTFLMITGGALLLPRQLRAADSTPDFPPMLDHILLGCSDLHQGIAFVEQRTGVRPAIGGVHPGRGTRNALLSLGELHYLEVIAPDPAQSSLPASVPSLLNTLRHLAVPRIVQWAAHTSDVEALAAKLREAGIAFQGPTPGSRKRPDGRVLNWQTLNLDDNRSGLLPFFIQWGAGSLHPSIDAPAGCKLKSFAAGDADSSELGALFRRLGLQVHVENAAGPLLKALIVGPNGQLDLTSRVA